eukprot:scaffold405737_cov29-Prasinocladus_malaysianus.AAC.2
MYACQVAVDRVTASQGRLRLHVFGEYAPRIFKVGALTPLAYCQPGHQDVDAFVSMGKGYRNLELDFKAWVCERDPTNKKVVAAPSQAVPYYVPCAAEKPRVAAQSCCVCD